MSEQLFTLEEARGILAVEHCHQHGHSWLSIVELGGVRRLYCEECPSWADVHEPQNMPEATATAPRTPAQGQSDLPGVQAGDEAQGAGL